MTSRKTLAALVGLATALILCVGLGSTASAETTPAASTTAPVVGTLADGTGAVAGTFDVQQFVAQNGTMQAVGAFTPR